MLVKTLILPSFYQDSVVLMRVAAEVRNRSGIREAAAFMGTAANRALLGQAGLATRESQEARPEDLILAVAAETEAQADEALAAARDLLATRRQPAAEAGEVPPRTFEAALHRLPGANLVAVSVPGAYAAYEALRALRRGLHVFLFSDHVPLADEIRLKQEARRRHLLCMGPDCGTAYLGGVGLGFANVVPRGRVGVVAASGTGLQAVASRLAALGEGISQAIGVGGRDLSREVGGLMTVFALEALATDPATAAILLIAKPPDPDVLPALERALQGAGKPAVACCLGLSGTTSGGALWVETLDDAADAGVALLDKREWKPRPFRDPTAVRARLGRMGPGVEPTGAGLLGLYAGGTLAQEARLLLEPLLGPVGFNGPATRGPHRILDLGDGAYTVGRPHPMIDPEARAERIRAAGRASGVAVLLFDLMLGRGAHPDPAGSVATAVREARATAERDGRRLLAVASVVGTRHDPQDLARQSAQLEEAGVAVLPTNAEAARFTALLLEPTLGPRLLEGA